jgi:hypothetical protein
MKESGTIIRMLITALKRLPIQEIFDKDVYEGRRTELKGSRLVNCEVLVKVLENCIEVCFSLTQFLKSHRARFNCWYQLYVGDGSTLLPLANRSLTSLAVVHPILHYRARLHRPAKRAGSARKITLTNVYQARALAW